MLPVLRTERLVLDAFTQDDVPRLEQILSVKEVAQDILRMKHPLPEGEAARWIATLAREFENNNLVLAVRRSRDNLLLGAVSLNVEPLDRRGSLGYWLDRDHWGRGYVTEASKAILEYGFHTLDLNKVTAECFSRNLASQKVMTKIGMKHEGSKKKHYEKWGEFLDSEEYGILREDWEQNR